MMRNFILLIICMCFMCSCSANKAVAKSDCECNKERILKIVEKEAKSFGYAVGKMEKTITEKDDYFLIEYMPPRDNFLLRAGGCAFKISKETCKITDKYFNI